MTDRVSDEDVEDIRQSFMEPQTQDWYESTIEELLCRSDQQKAEIVSLTGRVKKAETLLQDPSVPMVCRWCEEFHAGGPEKCEK